MGGDSSACSAPSHGDSDGNVLNGLKGILSLGMAIGAVAGVAYTAFNNSKSPSTLKTDAPLSASTPPAINGANNTVPCTNICKRLAACLESNEFDINRCPGYLDMLKACQKN